MRKNARRALRRGEGQRCFFSASRVGMACEDEKLMVMEGMIVQVVLAMLSFVSS
jgi:hypothetical protein